MSAIIGCVSCFEKHIHNYNKKKRRTLLEEDNVLLHSQETLAVEVADNDLGDDDGALVHVLLLGLLQGQVLD